MSLRFGALLGSLIVVVSANVRADALPWKRSLRLGHPLREVPLSIQGGEALTLQVGARRTELPARGASDVDVQVVPVTKDASVAIVRVRAENGEWTLLLGGRGGTELLATGRSDFAGDPGERRALVVNASPKDATGMSTVTVGTRFESLSLCGNRSALLDARVLAPDRLALVPTNQVTVTPAPSAIDAQLAATGSSLGTPALRGLEPVASSELDTSTSLPIAPRALTDGSTESVWRSRAGGFATLRWAHPNVAIERFELTFAGTPAERPRELLLLTDQDAALRVALSPELSESPTVVVTPAAPINTRCVALVVSAADTPQGVTIAQLAAYTEIDREGGLDRVVGKLVQDGDDGAAAADLLTGLGARGAAAVNARFDELSPRGKRRALRVLAKHLDLQAVRARVTQAARSDDADVSGQAMAALEAGGAPAKPLLRELALEGSPAGDRAARALAQDASETPTLLSALAKEGGADRPALRRALIQLGKRDPASFAAAASTWLRGAPSVSARAGLALVAAASGQRELARTVAEANLPQALRFEDRYRFTLALSQAPASEAADGWLANQAKGAEEWMLRRAAYEALEARNPDKAKVLAPDLASDAYPRVRAVALASLAKAGQLERVQTIAREDSWPLVRVAAVRALTEAPGARPMLQKLLDDTSRHVRSATIQVLAAQKAQELWPAVRERLEAEGEWPEVRQAAVGFARALCIQDARAPLGELVRRALRPDASEEDAQLALDALAALHALGGEGAQDAKLLVSRDGAPPALAKSLAKLPPSQCPR